jgi:hypothetical protein
LLFSPSSRCIALQLQLFMVGSFLSKVGQFSFKYHPKCHEISSRIHHWTHFGKLTCHHTPTFSLC